MNQIQLAIFDMEGTLFRKEVRDSEGNTAPSAWAVLAEHLGAEAKKEEEQTKDKWNNDEYAGYVEWMEETVSIHQKYGLTHDDFTTILESTPYRTGVHETFTALRERDVITALVTGGFKHQANRAQQDLNIDHAFAACEYFWDDDGSLRHWNLLPCDYKGKIDFIRLIMEEHGLAPDECAFVGDGSNDVHLAEMVGTSISYNGPSELEDAATHVINQSQADEDFTAVLQHLL